MTSAGSGRRTDSVDELVAAARAGEPRAVARLISLVEADDPRLPVVAGALAPFVGRARSIGLTGSPGVGKSTTTSALVTALRARGTTVGVLAIDPSSPFTGGALLGDRIRMGEHTTDPGVFIRSMATRGHLGGLATAAPQALRILDAAGCEVILVETVGVGQAEVEIASLADSTIVLLAPGMGDGIQAAKAGILEIADVLVVNKADREGADTAARQLRQLQTLNQVGSNARRIPVVKTVASTGQGIDDLLAALDDHWTWLASGERLLARRRARARAEIEALAVAALRHRFDSAQSALLDRLAVEVASGKGDPHSAADALLASVLPAVPAGD